MQSDQTCTYCALMFSATILSAMGYLTFAAVQGEYGLLRLLQIEAQEEQLSVELAGYAAERAALENRVRRLSSGTLDLDMLDERARAVLAFGRADELMIP